MATQCYVNITCHLTWWAKFYLATVKKLAKPLLFIFGEEKFLKFSEWIVSKGICVKVGKQ